MEPTAVIPGMIVWHSGAGPEVFGIVLSVDYGYEYPDSWFTLGSLVWFAVVEWSDGVTEKNTVGCLREYSEEEVKGAITG